MKREAPIPEVLSTYIMTLLLAGSGLNVWGQGEKPAASAEKTSFEEVTSQLDVGGNFYLYLGTESFLKNLSGKVSQWREIANAIPNLNEKVRENVPKVFDLVSRLIRKSGVEEISGFGMSSIAREPELYHTKVLLHHYPGQGSGFLWSMFGKSGHELEGLNLLPETTALAGFMDLDLPMLFSVLKQELSQCGISDVEGFMREMPGKFEEGTGMALDRLLGSFAGEFGLIFTLDESKKITVPVPLPQPIEIPEFGLAIIAKVRSDILFNRLDELMKQNPQVISREQEGVKSRTLPLALPLPLPIRPTLATGHGYLYLCSSDAVLDEILAVKSGKKASIKGSDEFKGLSRGVPSKGNSFSFMSARFGRAMLNVQKTAMQAAAASGAPVGMFEKLLGQSEAPVSYAVSSNTDQGWLTVGNGNQHAAKAILAPLVAVPVGLIAAIAIPNFVKAREAAQRNASQRNAIINNLHQIEGAKEQWAIEHKKKEGDMPQDSEVAQYCRGGLPASVRGERYQINAVGQKAVAKLPDGGTIEAP